jgi:hypothetical protein
MEYVLIFIALSTAGITGTEVFGPMSAADCMQLERRIDTDRESPYTAVCKPLFRDWADASVYYGHD